MDEDNFHRLFRSGLFHAAFYRGELVRAGMIARWNDYSCLEHYVRFGWKLGLSPSVHFSTKGYLARYPEVASCGMSPLEHFVFYGEQDGFSAVPCRELARAHYVMAALAELQDDVSRSGLFNVLRRGAWFLASNGFGSVPKALQALSSKAFGGGTRFSAPGAALLHEEIENPESRFWFLNPTSSQKVAGSPRIALHIHCFYPELIDDFTSRLKRSRRRIDLFVSVPDHLDPSVVGEEFKKRLAGFRIVVRSHVNRGRDLAPMIAVFGKELLRYDIIGHLHTKRSPHNSLLATWREEVLNTLLCGTVITDSEAVPACETAFALLSNGAASFVCAQRPLGILFDESGWGAEHREVARALLQRCGLGDFDLPARVDFPEGSMFWATKEAIKPLLTLPLTLEDFPMEPIPEDGTLAHALERLIFVLGRQAHGRVYRLCLRNYPENTPFFEEQEDFRGRIRGTAPKVLAYYLPQFHPTPENDAWHGKGFTEWTKVRNAQPLFRGHRQQRQPHPDVGYYQLKGTDVLKRQSEMMKTAGVHGMIFYHYWFSGRLILEKPAAELLADPSVEMPFCFCWANENWTKRWDGSDQQILLQQEYSRKDAEAFIRYIIPFFKDPRYIRYEGRPLLFVYRPALMPLDVSYVEIWRRLCIEHGVEPPYVVGTLKDDQDAVVRQSMQAAVERVLHDWTGGAVAPIDSTLTFFEEPASGVLDYKDVAHHYMNKQLRYDLPVIRSIVPAFDNTPRYGTRAHITHNVDPETFGIWFRRLVEQSEQKSGFASEFIVVNAWNEWAETAMIEPDTAFGYAYLNAIGRALVGSEEGEPKSTDTHVHGVHFHIAVPQYVEERFGDGNTAFLRFAEGIRLSEIGNVSLSTNSLRLANAANILHSSTPTQGQPNTFVADLRRMFLPSRSFFQRLVRAAREAPGDEIVPLWYGSHEAVVSAKTMTGRLHKDSCLNAPLIVRSGREICGSRRLLRRCIDAFSVVLHDDRVPELRTVDTIVRVHAKANFSLLERALISLCAQCDVAVRPIVMAQDLNPKQVREIEAILAALPWRQGVKPSLSVLASTQDVPDTRARLLMLGVQEAKSDFVAFLDYDDLMFVDGYAKLVARFDEVGKGIIFGRVFRAVCSDPQGWMSFRDRMFEYGGTYTEFLAHNHAPIHSYIVHRNSVDLSRIDLPTYRYMEDYLMLMQIATETNADWSGLGKNIYVGDYMYYPNAPGTLALMDDALRQKVLGSEEYRAAEQSLNELRKKKGLN